MSRATIAHVQVQVKRFGRAALCVVLVVAVVAFYRHVIQVNTTTVALTFLLAVLVISAYWGFWYAAFLAVISTLAFNFYFLPPFGTFTIADPQNWVALFAFLATAVVSSQLSEQARRQTANANQRRREIEHLYAFSQRLLTIESVSELLNLVPRHITETFASKGAAILVHDRVDVYRSGADTREIDSPRLQSVMARGEPMIVPEQALAFIPLRLGVRSIGAIGISGAHLSHETFEALSTIQSNEALGAGLDRERKQARQDGGRRDPHHRSLTYGPFQAVTPPVPNSHRRQGLVPCSRNLGRRAYVLQ